VSEQELSFELPGGAHALFTTRAHGNLSSVDGENGDRGVRARERLREHCGVRRLARGRQVHGVVVQRVKADADPPGPAGDSETYVHPGARPELVVKADGQATGERGVGMLVLTADCLPVALGTTGAVAMVHAGWRGLAGGVLEAGVRAVRELGGVEEVVAIVGPGAGACCYEVGDEVHGAFGGAHRDGTRIDLKAIARDRLLAAGVSGVRDVAACTICDERFFSYRREGARAGRQGGVAWSS
jgi:YfiH family protein